MYQTTKVFHLFWNVFFCIILFAVETVYSENELTLENNEDRNHSNYYEMTPPTANLCSSFTNTTCEKCVKASKKCYYCYKSKQCAYYPYKHLVTQDDCGSLGEMAWTTCLVNFEALIISMSIVGSILFLAIAICCCCCCRSINMQNQKWDSEEAKLEEQSNHSKKMDDSFRKKEKFNGNTNKSHLSVNQITTSEQALLLNTSSV
ncbi:pituitary tumor-transforming gene 1 protein-interacting protein-like [Centruroides vittatus]|uniref:pituitary tumor-transforming gene 1 protein-interacting protein-like n=1 Tax=Centruroides vittatus TaxID=120091 RepID=UPI0035108952